MIIYRFDSPETYRFVESLTSGRAVVEPTPSGNRPGLRVSLRCGAHESTAVAAVLALPLRSIDGPDGAFVLEADVDQPDVQVRLHGLAANGRQVSYALVRTDTDGAETFRADVNEPESHATGDGDNSTKRTPLPIQLHQLSIRPAPDTGAAEVTLYTLGVIGDLRQVPSGLA